MAEMNSLLKYLKKGVVQVKLNAYERVVSGWENTK